MTGRDFARSMRVVARALGRMGRERARSIGSVTPQQADALQIVAERGVLSTSELARLLGIDPSTASRNLTGLERAGLILRKRGSDDGRQTDLHLTSRGKRLTETISAEWVAACVSMLERIPRAERTSFAERLDALARLLDPGD
ncbi:MAG: MarR family winged helix-turn-helix transcriptional regulator [Polyangiaceae bacterium]